MNADITSDELLAVMCAGGRLSDERSAALPENYYSDPAKSFKFASEIDKAKARKEAKKFKKSKKSKKQIKIKDKHGR